MHPQTHPSAVARATWRFARRLAVSVTFALLLVAQHVALAGAEIPQTSTERPGAERAGTEQLVFSMGLLEAVDGGTVTVSFPDGPSEVYDLGPDTAIQTQNGDAQSVADLEVGSRVIVLSHEGDPTAITIVNGGDTGFHEAGPADIRGHENDSCPPCEASVSP